MAYFFAYGDRMSTSTMQRHAPHARLVGPGILAGYRLAFNVRSRSWGGGAANALTDPHGTLWGVLWEVDETDLAALDSYRGDDETLRHDIDVDVQGPEGTVQARTFAVTSHEAFIRPTERYVDMLKANAAGQGLPEEALASIDRASQGARGPAPTI
jgi:hypothetical protein